MKRQGDEIDLLRRRVVQAVIALPAFTLIGCGSSASANGGPASVTAPSTLNPTPACDDGDDDPTPAQTEGPYFKSSSPERTSLVEAGVTGTLLTISGRVLSTACQPVAAAKLDFWQADNAGNYDNVGFRLRGHQFTDENGRFSLQTIVPGLYPGRTRHIHVKAQAPNRGVLTTQVYFPGEARNATDGLYSSALLMSVEEAAGGRTAAFDFVLSL
jgi:protocatechuate 3,4-dioxygenase beta subunit